MTSTAPRPRRLRGFFATFCALLVTLSLALAMTPTASADPADPGQPDPTVSATQTTGPTDAATPPVDDATPPVNDATPSTGDTTTVAPGVTVWQPTTAAQSQPTNFDGYIPPQFDTAAINDGSYSTSTGALQATSLPSSYNLQQAHPTWLSGLRNQGTWGTCWAFAASEAAETSLVRNGVLTGYEATTQRQISTLHLTQSVYLSNTFTPLVSNPLATGGAYMLGGNDFQAAAAWAHWYGAQKESTYPYPTNLSVAPPLITPLQTSAYHLRNQWVLPAPRNSKGAYSATNVNTIKNAIYNYGAAMTAFKGSLLNVAPYYNSTYQAFYDPNGGDADHAVLIIGWNDNFPAYEFGMTPPGPGAFYIQNSWGSNTSYFWLSYYDTTMYNSSIFDMVSATPTANYQSAYGWTDEYSYDQLGGGAYITNSPAASSANKFTARQDTTLRAIQFYAPKPNISYKLSVYVGAIKSNSPVTGGSSKSLTTSGSKTISGKVTYAGYNTVTLKTPVILKAGQKFSIVMSQTDSSKKSLVPIEYKWTNPYYSMNLTISSGQSYMQNRGKWYDITSLYKSWNWKGFGNVNIIALTSPKPTNQLTLDANGGTVSPASKTVTYNSKIGTLPTPTRTGYTFKGWYTATSGGSKYTSTTKVTFIGDKNLYARWKAKTYTAKFSANGGSTPTKSGKAYKSKTVTFGKTYGALPTTKRTGYTFAGWFTDKLAGTQVISTTPINTTGTRTLYAHWTPKTYTVNFNPRGGLVSPTSEVVTYGSTYGWLPTPTQPGYTFVGWYTKTSGGSLITIASTVKITATTTLYARWTQ